MKRRYLVCSVAALACLSCLVACSSNKRTQVTSIIRYERVPSAQNAENGCEIRISDYHVFEPNGLFKPSTVVQLKLDDHALRLHTSDDGGIEKVYEYKVGWLSAKPMSGLVGSQGFELAGIFELVSEEGETRYYLQRRGRIHTQRTTPGARARVIGATEQEIPEDAKRLLKIPDVIFDVHKSIGISIYSAQDDRKWHFQSLYTEWNPDVDVNDARRELYANASPEFVLKDKSMKR